MGRTAAGLFSLVIAGSVAFPVIRGPGHDSYPLSTYPMFALDRGRTSAIATAMARDAGGAELVLAPQLVGGTHEPVHAAATVSGAVAAGQAERLCGEVAERVRASGPAQVVRVEVVTVTYDPVAYFNGPRVPLDRAVHATCPVSR